MEKEKTVFYIQSIATEKKLLADSEIERVFWVETNEFTEFTSENKAWAYLEKWFPHCEVYEDFKIIEIPLGVSTDRNAL